MAERWRTPAVPLAVEMSDQGIVLPDGREQRVEKMIWSEEEIERFRSGYRCAKCLEPFEQAWPERCPLCGVAVHAEQAAYFAREYGGEVQLGSRVSLAEELEQLPERVEEERRRGT